MTWRSTCNYFKLFLFFVPSLLISISSFSQNSIVTENSLAGTPYSEWGVPDFRDNRIAGFATKMSLNRGETVRFKVNVQGAANFTMKIYRIGYYSGNGARLKQDLGTLPGTIQPAGISDPVTGILDCGNWSESASWSIPATAVSGFYVAKIERVGGGSNHIVFIVRNDASTSDIYFQLPDATWQAYNGYGGNSMYDGTTGFPGGHAVKASYNRPFFPYNSAFNTDGRGADWYMNSEYPMIRWLERNGYNVTYTSSNDVANNGSRIMNHKIFMTNGHDEYWSKEQRNNVEAARNAGVHLAFFTGNEVYWKTRWESLSGSENRTLVCYKEGLLGDGTAGERACGSKCDGSTSEWTGLWRTGGNYDAGKPENALVGQISWVEFPAEIGVPAFYKKLRFWRNSAVANLSTGQTAFLGFQTLGYEWDYEQYPDTYPSGRITMSSRTINSLTHKLSLYRHSSGALVFGAGTVQWSWGLDGNHWGGNTTVSPEMQQATVNLFADMGVQPGSLQSGLVAASASTDATAPSATLTAPSNGSTFPSGSTINITGTATDAGGGVVAGVEVSLDGGNTWKQATLNTIDNNVTWSYAWVTTSNGTFNIRFRSFDDSGNIGTAGPGINVNVGGPDVTPPTVTSVSPLNGSGGITIGTTVVANFSETINSATVTSSTFQLKNGSNVVAGTLSHTANQVTFTPSSVLLSSTLYTVTIKGGSTGVKDVAGNPLASDYTWTFTTGTVGSSSTIFQPTDAPANPLSSDGSAISLGVRFRSSQNGFITGIRYYKGAGTTGTHTGHLWSNNGTPLAQVTFNSETASGWQQAFFSTPVAVTAGVTYVASYFSPSGQYAATKPYFTQAVVNGPLRGLADGEDGPNGLYQYSPSAVFPGNSFQSSNYWVDVVFTTSGGADVTAPTVTSVTPLNAATGVGTGTTVVANFSEAVNASTVSTSTFQLRGPGSTLVNATVSTVSNQIILTPSAALIGSTTYTATITGGASGVKDLAGNALASNYVWSFTTAASDVTPPTVTSVTPTGGATGIGTGTTVVANFSESLNASTVTTGTFQLRDAGNNLIPATVSTASNQISLLPSAALSASATYTATITSGASGVKDLAGNPLASNFSWSFTTAAGGSSGCPCTVFQPTDGPTALANDGTGIALGMKFRSTQNGFITGIRYYKGAGSSGTRIGSLWSATGTLLAQVNFTTETATGWQQALFSNPVAITAGVTYIASYFSPSGDYVATKPYFTQAVVNGPLRALADGEDGSNGLYRYTTSMAFPNSSFNSSNYWVDVVFATSGGADVTAPTVTSVSPLNTATGVSTGTAVIANFSEAINASTVTTGTFQLRGPGSTLVTATVNTVSNQVMLTPSVILAGSTTYTATITGGGSGVKDLAGNALAGNYVWSFTTAASDITPPTVVSVTPLSGATGVGTGTAVAANFSESLNASSVTSATFQLRDAGNNLIPSTVSTASNQINLVPSAALAASTTYTVTITGGASGVKDLAGNALASNFAWSFTTAAGSGGVGIHILPQNIVPESPRSNDGTGIALGVKFSSTQNGTITGVRYFKGAGTTGTHTGQLWTNTGTLLAQATFTNETATGWQTALFSTPVSITANVVYVASYHSPSGDFAATINFYTQAVINGPLRGLANGESGPNGLYRYSNSVVFPNNGYQASNYWADVVFVPADAGTAPVITLHPQSQAVCSNSQVTFNSSATGSPAPTIQWQESTNGTTWTNISGATSGTLNVTATPALNNRQYRAVWTNTAGTVNSSPATLTVNAIPTAPVVTVTNNCGSSLLTASGFSGSLLWSTGATTTSITVTSAGTYTVTQTVNGCTSGTGIGVAAPNNSVVSVPVVTVTNNCNSSILTASGFTGSLLWSTGATTPSITVTAAGTYTVTQTVNGCTSPEASGIAAPKPIPPAPTVTVTDNCTSSVLTASNFSGSLLWSNGATTPSITVSAGGTFTVVQTLNGCTSAAGSGVASPKPIPPAPTVSVINNCGNSVLTASNFTGSLLWSNGATTPSITVTSAGTYTVTQSINGCTSASGSGVAAPNSSAVPAPAVIVTDDCGNSVLTASGYTGTLLWSTGAVTPSIIVSAAGTYTVTQTVNGCTSTEGSGTASPKPNPPAPTVTVTDNCTNSVLTASNFSGSLLWSNGATTPSITVSAGGTFTVVQTLNGCASAAGSGVATPKPIPPAPTVTVINNCGNSVLTAGNFTGSLLWSNGATTPSITVTSPGTYTVTQTINGCTSASGNGVAAPNSSAVPAPVVGVTDNCGNSVLTASGFTGSLLWSTGATTTSIIVTSAAIYTVTQTVNGCSSPAGGGLASPKGIPAAPEVSVTDNCTNSVLTASGFTGSLLWSNGAITPSITVSDAGAYTVTQIVNGCSSTQGSGVAAPKPIPPAPTVAVVNNCGNSVLTASGFTGSLLWSTGATTASVTVTSAGTYSVTQTVNSCTSQPGSEVAAPLNSSVATPGISVLDSCGYTVLTATNYTGSLLWNTGETSEVIRVATPGLYTVTQTVNSCASTAANATASPKTIPAAPTVSVTDNCTSSQLTASGFTGTLLWSNAATTPSITVSNAGVYTVTQNVNGCTSSAGIGTASPKPIPPPPAVSVVNSCGNAELTASGYTGTLLWSTGATTPSITVTQAGPYTVTQTVNGCTSTPGTGTAEPNTTSVPAPVVTVSNVCGSAELTASGFTGSLLWSNGATTTSITVNTGGVYTVTQSLNGCTSQPGSGTATPKPTPVLTSNLTAIINSGVLFNYTPTSNTGGTTFTWSRAQVAGISNEAANGAGNISETLLNTTPNSIEVTYVITLTADGCVNTQNVVVTVHPVSNVTCTMSGSITSSFTNTAIPAGRYIWFNSVLDRGSFTGITGNVTFYITNSKISFTANNQQYVLNVPDAEVSYETLVLSASTNFVNNAWNTIAPRGYTSFVFATGLAYQVPVNFPGGISNIQWTANIGVNKTGVAISWKWAAAVYTSFASHAGLNIKPIGGLLQNPYLNTDKAGAPENFKSFLVSGGKGNGGTNYTGNYSSTQNISCVPVSNQRSGVSGPPAQMIYKAGIVDEQLVTNDLDVVVMPNPTRDIFNVIVKGNPKESVSVRVFDIFGQLLERHDKLFPGELSRFGHTWRNGTYVLEVMQGSQRKVVKIIKAD